MNTGRNDKSERKERKVGSQRTQWKLAKKQGARIERPTFFKDSKVEGVNVVCGEELDLVWNEEVGGKWVDLGA